MDKQEIKEKGLVALATLAFFAFLGGASVIHRNRVYAEGGIILSQGVTDCREVYSSQHDGVADKVYQTIPPGPYRCNLGSFKRKPTQEEKEEYANFVKTGKRPEWK